MTRDRLDTDVLIETPEGIDLTAQLAGPIVRIAAYLIDLLIRYSVLAVFMFFVSIFGEGGWGLFLILSFIMEWLYPVFFEVLSNGQTPGKKALSITTVHDDLTAITWRASFLRNLLRAADFLPFVYMFGLFSMLLNRDFKRLGDLAAGTLVIHKETKHEVQGLPDVQPISPTINLSREEQVAIIDFTQNYNRINPNRQQELAEILQDMTGKKGDAAVRHLHGIGLWLLGGKS